MDEAKELLTDDQRREIVSRLMDVVRSGDHKSALRAAERLIQLDSMNQADAARR